MHRLVMKANEEVEGYKNEMKLKAVSSSFSSVIHFSFIQGESIYYLVYQKLHNWYTNLILVQKNFHLNASDQ